MKSTPSIWVTRLTRRVARLLFFGFRSSSLPLDFGLLLGSGSASRFHPVGSSCWHIDSHHRRYSCFNILYFHPSINHSCSGVHVLRQSVNTQRSSSLGLASGSRYMMAEIAAVNDRRNSHHCYELCYGTTTRSVIRSWTLGDKRKVIHCNLPF